MLCLLNVKFTYCTLTLLLHFLKKKKGKNNKYNNYVIIFHYNIFIYYNPKGYLSTQVYLTYENLTFNKLNI